MKCEACEHENVEGARFCAKCGALLPTSPVEGDDPLVGQLIGGRYRITGVLGEGGMGKVYVGEQQMGTTVRKVAVKTLHKHLSQDPSVLARFHRECGTVAQLEHPNTIKFYDFGATQDGTLYIAMEFVKGRPLMDAIEQGGPMAPDRVLRILKQVCGALDEAHKQGIIHRDLKPENVILTDRAGEVDFVKVLDFGIAARSESADAAKEAKLTQQGMVLGTPPYMSPEQFTGKALDQRSDIYSLGVMAYEMLTGKLPFQADTPWEWATQHMTVQPTPFEVSAPEAAARLPAALRAAILKALNKDREQRQATCKDFFAELSGGGGLTVEAPALGASSPALAVPGGPTAAMPVMPEAPRVPAATPGPMGPPPVVAPAIPPAAPRQATAGGGGKGLIIGLGALVGVLGLAIVVVVLQQRKPEDDVTLQVPTSTGSTGVGPLGVGPVGEIKPVDAPPVDTAPPPTSEATDAGPKPTPPRPTPTTKPTTSATAKGPTGAAACDACIAAAQGGNITGASANYARCDDAGKKAQCTALVRSRAPGAVQSHALNNQCSQAKATAAAATSMGAGSGALTNALGKCK